MDQWEALLETYHDPPDIRCFIKAIQVAENVVKTDLATFEIDRFIQTLLFKPISLLDTIYSQISDDAWTKPIGDAYKLLENLVEKYPYNADHWIDDIVQICEIPLDPRTRVYALGCLSVCTRLPRVELSINTYLLALENSRSCKAPLAVLLGAICEYSPETVGELAIHLWRVYLQILDTTKITDTIIYSVLKGILGLFKHFGMDLPMVELTKFYRTMSREYVRISKCATIIQSMLSNHCVLFKNAISRDFHFRQYLWNNSDYCHVLPTVYKHILPEYNRIELSDIINTELLPQSEKCNSFNKYAALRILHHLDVQYKIPIGLFKDLDIYTLEFELKNEVDVYSAEGISFCLDCKMPNWDKVLQASILFYYNLPQQKVKYIVVNTILKLPTEQKNATINFLISETCQPNVLNTYLPLWKEILESELKEKRYFFEYFMSNLIYVLDMFLEEKDLYYEIFKPLPEKLSSLLSLTSHVLTLTPPEDYTIHLCTIVAKKVPKLFVKSGVETPIVEALKGLGSHLGNREDFGASFKMLQIDRCKNEELLCEMSLALLHAPDSTQSDDVERMILALEVIFTRKDAEPKTLSLALNKLEYIVINAENVDSKLRNIIKLVEKLRNRIDLVGKEARVLQREVILFLGKYANFDVSNNNFTDHSFAIELKDKITLDIPNTIEGVTYKMNLSRQMLLSIEEQNEDTLHMMLTVLCADSNISSKPYQEALGELLAACGRGAKYARVVDAAHLCQTDALNYIIEYIHNCSPGVRKMLCDVIEGILLKDQRSTSDLLIKVTDRVIMLLSSTQLKSKQIGLDLSEAILSVFKENNELTQLKLLDIITLITKTNEVDSYTLINKASNLLADKIELFTSEKLTSTIIEILTNLSKREIKDPISAKHYKNLVKAAISLIRLICDTKDIQITGVLEELLALIGRRDVDNDKFLRVVGELTLQYDHLIYEETLELYDRILERLLFETKFNDEFQLENVLMFVYQFIHVLLRFNREQLQKFIKDLIKNMQPKYVAYLEWHLATVLFDCQDIIVLNKLTTWTETLSLDEVTNNLEKNIFVPDDFDNLKALNIMIEAHKMKLKRISVTLIYVNTFAQKWPRIILKMFSTGIVKHLTAELPFLADLLSVGLKFLTITDVKNLVLEGHNLEGVKNQKLGVEFCGYFMHVFIKYFLRKPFILLDSKLNDCVVLLTEIVKFVVKKRTIKAYTNLFELIDKIWPRYEALTDFRTKHKLLLDISFLDKKLSSQSEPMKWAQQIICDENNDIKDKIALIGVLPSGEEFSETYKIYASLLPTRLSDVSGIANIMLRAMIDAMSINGDLTLLDVIATLADGDPTEGWWDGSFNSCMANLARTPYVQQVYSVLYGRLFEGMSTGLCTRLLVPLIRFSHPTVVTNFVSSKIDDLLVTLLPRRLSLLYTYQKYLVEVVRALHVFAAVLEKVPPEYVESPTSPLYSWVNNEVSKPYHLAREIGKACCALRERINARDPRMDDTIKELQRIAYNCLCACVTLWKPDERVYRMVFEVSAWENIIGYDDVYNLPIRTQWDTKMIAVSTPVRSQASCGSNRTRLFLRTLSENPLLYDLIDNNDNDQIETLEVALASTELNNHPCASTLTALIVHAIELGHKQWAGIVSEALSICSVKVRWLLAQIIYNLKEEIKPFGDDLSIGLFSVIIETSVEIDGKKQLNGLHVDILSTIIHWGDIITYPNEDHINKVLELLINTIVSNGDKKAVYVSLTLLFNQYVDLFDQHIIINWNALDEYVEDAYKSNYLLPIFTKITTNKIYVPELLPNLLSKLYTNSYNQVSKLGPLIGLAIECDTQRIRELNFLLDHLKKTNINDYVKLLYYSKYCDASNFRTIVDLALKLPASEKNKCVAIIHTYMCENPGFDVLNQIPLELRYLVEEKCGVYRFEEFFRTQSTNQPPAKRPRVETTSPILNTIIRNEIYFNSLLVKLGKEMHSKVLEKLCAYDMGVRFTECFYIAVYLPTIYTENKVTDLSVCLTEFFSLLFHKLKSEPRFKEAKLRDTPINIDNRQFAKIVTKTKTYIGTLRSHSYSTNKINGKKDKVNTIDVQIPIEKILDTLIEFSKVSLEASMDLLKQLLICIKQHKFDNIYLMGYMVYKLMDKNPIFLDISRILVDTINEIDGLSEKLEELKLSSVGTDVEALFRLFYEEVRLRKLGPEQFILGGVVRHEPQDELMPDELKTFSLEAIVSSFKKLSNWQDLAIRERHIQSVGLPWLWTDNFTILKCLEKYTEKTTWFGKMVALHKDRNQDTWKWLRHAEAPPLNFFEVSAITEAIQWYEVDQPKHYEFTINNKDCLMEWAARLMIRSVHLFQKAENTENIKLTRSQELIWCKRAIEMELPELALNCVKKNAQALFDHETLPWLEQRVTAQKMIGLKQNDNEMLRNALDAADRYTTIFQVKSSQESAVGMQSLRLELNYKLKTLDTTKIDLIKSQVETQLTEVPGTNVTIATKSRLSALYSTCMIFYNDHWNENTDAATKNTYLDSMLSIIRNSIDMNLQMRDHFLSMLFNELENFTEIDQAISSHLIQMIKYFLKTQPTLFNHLLKTKLQSHPIFRLCVDQEMTAKKFTTCLQLVADPDYMLNIYIHELDVAASETNPESWKNIFLKIKDKFFENPYIGTDYQPLLKYKNKLYEIENYDSNKLTKMREVLNQIKAELSTRTPTNVLRLSQLCPDLSQLNPDEKRLSQILGLKKDEIIIKFDEQVHVYTDSVVRPCVLTALLSNGKKIKFLIKQVNMWRAAAAITVAGMYPLSHNGYNIIPISEDCGIIQYLEDHVRLQQLIANTINLGEIPIARQCTKEEELVLATRQASLSNFKQICDKIPPYTLRTAIENKCLTVQDFINKRIKYLDTLCSMTILNYLFGIGDRHLENILYNIHDGGLQIIDLDSVFQFGTTELPPARLTRNVLAVIDIFVIESHLQRKLKSLRDNSRFLIETIKYCFQKNDEEFEQKLPYIEGTVTGTKLSNQITEDSLQKSNKTYKDKYIELLKEVFADLEIKNQYTVEEQVSNLLFMCTDPRILSVTRTGWEPWL